MAISSQKANKNWAAFWGAQVIRLLIFIAIFLTSTTSFSQVEKTEEPGFGCLVVEKYDPGEQLVKWCLLDKTLEKIPCYELGTKEKPITPTFWTDVSRELVDKWLNPTENPCPALPKNVTGVEILKENEKD